MAHEGPNRIREIPADKLTPAQQAAIEAVLGGRGRIPGPYKIWLHSRTSGGGPQVFAHSFMGKTGLAATRPSGHISPTFRAFDRE